MHIHCIGVAGAGMGTLAGLLRSAGHEVSGSDTSFDPPIGPELAGWGIRCLRGYDPSHLDPAPDCVVVGNVCRADNAEAEAARARGMRITTMPHALADFVLAPYGFSPLVVCGTHGKTTTSSMAAWLLDRAGVCPGFFIGGLPKGFEAGFRLPSRGGGRTRLPLSLGSSEFARRVPFVIEGDEYDTAFFEKTPKFWHYRAEVAVVTSIEHDHIDIYPDQSSYEGAFREMLRRLPEQGLCLAAANDPRVVTLVRESARCPVRWFALEGDDTSGISPEWVGAPAPFRDGMQSFDLYVGGVAAGRCEMPVPGSHNIRNALAAMAACIDGYGCHLGDVRKGLATFQGVRRRQDLLAQVRGVSIYDDFAHHPTAVRETLHALRQKHSGGRLWAVFEPRSATACRALHQQEYATAFAAADRVILAPLGRTNIPEAERLDTEALARALRDRGKDAIAASSSDAILETLVREVQPGDIVALLSNGSFGGIHQRLVAALSMDSPQASTA